MDGDELTERVRELRSQGVPPKAIARTLGVPSARVVPVVRALAAQAEAAVPAGERPLVGCWVSPGWTDEVIVEDRPGWPMPPADLTGATGLVSLVVVRQDSRGRVRLYGYLVDMFCLGVKNVFGPKVLDPHHLDEFLRTYYGTHGGRPVAAPVELVRDVVFGAIEYAKGLGFEPTTNFTDDAAAHLGPWTPPGAVTFGRVGRPMFIQGPNDNPSRVLRTLRESVGDGNFDYLLEDGSSRGGRRV